MAQINPNYLTHISSELPEHLDLDEFIAACQRPLRKSIRVNTLKISVAAFIDIMKQKNGVMNLSLGVVKVFGLLILKINNQVTW